MKARIARREFFKRVSRDLGFLGVGSLAFESVIARLFAKALAQTAGASVTNAKNYVHLSLYGAPPRWQFDLPLTPMGKTAGNFKPGSFGTMVEKVGANFQPFYHVEKFALAGGREIYLPPVWKYDLKNGPRLASLLENTAFIRGVGTEINNHVLSNSRQVAPIVGSYSLHGVASDASALPIASIVDNATPSGSAFRSKKGVGATPITFNANPAQTLLRPFSNYFGNQVIHQPGANMMTTGALRQFERFAAARGITSAALPEAYDRAMDIVEAGNLIKLGDDWSAVVARYRAIVTEAMTDVGALSIFDTAIATSADNRFRWDEAKRIQLSNMKLMFDANATIPKLAENFALAEIMLGKVTSSMVLQLAAPTNLNDGVTANVAPSHDQHRVGSVTSTCLGAVYYRAVLACLAQFRQKLIAKGIFDDTLIHIASEFNRNPRLDHSGSDHAPEASNSTLISGMIKKNVVIGNIKVNTPLGTYGVSQNYKNWGRPIQANDVAWTISAMLGVDVIVTNGYVLLKQNGRTWERPDGTDAAETNNV